LEEFDHEEVGDIGLKGPDHAYIISELKYFLSKHVFSLAEGEGESEEINALEEDLDKMVFTEMRDNQNIVHFALCRYKSITHTNSHSTNRY
jgi:hypothetical protein